MDEQSARKKLRENDDEEEMKRIVDRLIDEIDFSFGGALKDGMDEQSARKKLRAHHQQQVPLGAFTNEKMKVGDSQITRLRQPEERVQMLQDDEPVNFELDLYLLLSQ